MQQINEKIIKINSKSIEQAVHKRLLYGKTIYLTNEFEARWLARTHCNLTVMKLSADFLGLNLIDSAVNREAASFGALSNLVRQTSRLMDYRSDLSSNYPDHSHEYPSDNRQDNYKLMNERPVNRDAYEFESASFVQHFGLTFREQSPYYSAFAQKITALKESSLIANLLHKWSRSACDRNLYSNSNEADLHNDKLDARHRYGHIGEPDYDGEENGHEEARIDSVHRPTDEPLLVDFARLNMAKFKKTENASINNARTNHFRANSKSTDRQLYATERLKRAGSMTGRLVGLFKQIANSSSSEHPWLNRICYLLALSLSLTCSIVLVELLLGARRRSKNDAKDSKREDGEDNEAENLSRNAENGTDENSVDRVSGRGPRKSRQTNKKQTSKNGLHLSTKPSIKLSEPLEQPVNDVGHRQDLVAVCELNDLASENCADYPNDRLANEAYRTDSRTIGTYRLCSVDGTAGYSADNYPDNTHRFANQQFEFHADPFTTSSIQHAAFASFDGYSQVSLLVILVTFNHVKFRSLSMLLSDSLTFRKSLLQ